LYGDGIDVYSFSEPGVDSLHGGPGNDFLFGGPRGDHLFGEDNDDLLFGENDDDTLDGGYGHDRLYGGYGEDTLRGYYGNDELYGEAGSDTLEGSYGNDRLVAGGPGDRGTDTLRGGWGNDSLYGDDGGDVLEGGEEDDTLIGGLNNDTLRGGGGIDTLDGGQGNDQLFGDAGNDTLRGGYGDDTLRGGWDRDILDGGWGNDKLYGGYHSDTLDGGNGHDGLYGGPDPDTLTGGAGSDRFLIHTDEIGSGDTITDRRSADSDARIEFHDGDRADIADTRGVKSVFDRGYFRPEEIEAIDTALAILHQATGNNKLLRTSTGGDLDFIRHGARLSGDANVSAWNSGSEWEEGENRIHLTDFIFNRAADGAILDDLTARAVFHEIGHNWDDENDEWLHFKSLSGWFEDNPHSDRFVQSGNGKWWHLQDADFINDYAKENPREDFAASFEAYFARALPTGPTHDEVHAAIPDKFDFVYYFVLDLWSYVSSY
jgi:hypothetical protein